MLFIWEDIVENIKATFRPVLRAPLPEFDNMDEYLDFIIPRIRPYGEDLYEKEFFQNKKWIEIRDDDNFHDKVVHLFESESEPDEIKVFHEDQGMAYYRSIDGNVTKGRWSKIANEGLLLKYNNQYELFKKAFMDEEYLILKKDGNNTHPRYMLLCMEKPRLAEETVEWRDEMEKLYDVYRYNFLFMVTVFVGIVLLVIFLYVTYGGG